MFKQLNPDRKLPFATEIFVWGRRDANWAEPHAGWWRAWGSMWRASPLATRWCRRSWGNATPAWAARPSTTTSAPQCRSSLAPGCGATAPPDSGMPRETPCTTWSPCPASASTPSWMSPRPSKSTPLCRPRSPASSVAEPAPVMNLS